MEQQAMHSPAISLATLQPFDWSRTRLGDPGAWSPCLRLSVDVMLNCPLPMLLMWGPEQAMLYNHAYAALTGAKPQSVPGGRTPSMQPAAWSWSSAAIEAAWAGSALHFPAQPLPFWRDGAAVQQWLDLFYTPVRDEHGVVRGILCAMQPVVAPDAGAASAERALRILVVEDNLDSQYLVCEMLRTFGHAVDAVARGEDALALIDSRRYDLLFSDVGLPGMSGVELARLTLARQPQICVVFASGYSDALTRHLEFPAVSIQKPYDIEQLQIMLSDIGRRLPPVAS